MAGGQLLADVFGVGSVRAKRFAECVERFVTISEERFEKVVAYCIKNCERFPTIKKLDEIAGLFPEVLTTGVRQRCAACENEGVVNAWKDGCRYLFRCEKCDIRLCAAIPRWSGSYANAGFGGAPGEETSPKPETKRSLIDAFNASL